MPNESEFLEQIASGGLALPGLTDDAPDVAVDVLAVAKRAEKKKLYSFPSIEPPTLDELRAMRLTPRCILPNFLFADVRCRIASGGTGKTTIVLFEAAMLALGRELWGHMPGGCCNTLIVTREDNRETLMARLREIMNEMLLSDEEQISVIHRVRIMDMSSTSFRLSVVENDVVLPSIQGIDELIEFIAASNFLPDWVILDPAVSFGVGESRVNDAEQGLIEAARIIRNRLNCCVEYIHHTGKANARDKTLDQYSGRGGSAFADGARMVCVMQPLKPEEWLSETGTALEEGWQGLVMALPKSSYTKPLPSIFVKRKGWKFELCAFSRVDPDKAREAIANQVWQFIRNEAKQGRKYSGKDLLLSKDEMNLSKHDMEAAVSRLKVTGRVVVVGKIGTKQVLEAIEVDREGTTKPSPAGIGEGLEICPDFEDDD